MRSFNLAILSWTVLSIGCDRAPAPATPPPTVQGEVKASSPAAYVISGQVSFSGDVPKGRRFGTGHDEEAVAALYPNGTVYDPVEVDQEKHVRWALVYVKKGLEGKSYAAPEEAKRLEISRFRISPRVLGIMVGQKLLIKSHDNVLHSIHAIPQANRESNVGLDAAGREVSRTFSSPEIGCRIFCEIHKAERLQLKANYDWETAWLSVLPHPFYAVTDSQGRFEIRDLPPGRYTLEAWQENCKSVTRELEIGAGPTSAIDFVLEPATE